MLYSLLNIFRTNTIILIDDKNFVTFVERNLKFPLDSENSEWEENVMEFELNQKE